MIPIVLFAVFFLVSKEKEARIAAQYRYRFPPTARQQEDTLKAMEDRVRRTKQDPLDLAALASQYIREARSTGEKMYYDKAELLAQQSLKKLSNPLALIVLAKAAEARHQFAESIRLAKKAAEEKPNAQALALLVTSHLAIGEEKEAVRYADRLIEISPGLSSYLLRALSLTAQGRDEESLENFKHALALEDIGESEESARARTLMARFLLKRGRTQESKALLVEALRIVPNYPLALDWLGECEARQRRFTEAEKHVLRAFSESKQVAYLTHYAKIKSQHGELQVAKEVWTQAEKQLRQDLNSGSFGHRLELAKLLLTRQNKEDLREAVLLTENEVKVRPNPESLGVFARSLLFLDRKKEARSAILAALRSGIRDAELYTLAGKIELAMQRKEAANFYFKMATETDPFFQKI